MKKTLPIILMFLFALTAYGQDQQPENISQKFNPPNFLIHQQLSPEIFKIEYIGGISSGVFKNSQEIELNRFRQNTLTVSGYPVTLINKKQQQLYLGFGYVHDQYVSFENEAATPDVGDSRKSIYLNAFLNTRIRNKFYWFSYVQGGVNATEPFNDMSKEFNYTFLNKVNYKIKRNLNAGLGVAYISNFGEPLVLPAITFVFSQRHYLLNIDFPVKVELEGILWEGAVRPTLGLTFPGGSYYIKDANQYFTSIGTAAHVGLRYRIMNLLYVNCAYQVGLNETFKSGNRGDLSETGSYSGQGRFVISLNVQVARFISSQEE